MKPRTCIAALAILTLCLLSCRPAAPVRIGSKEFTESEILSEMALRLGRSANARMEHIRALGGTRVLWDSLVKGEIDLYPEYTGPLANEIFAGKVQADKMAEALAAYGIGMSSSLGFDDSYALGMKQSQAQRLGITTISDLMRYPDLRFGFSNEFMDRRDGWAGLRRFYRLPQSKVTGLEHQLAYRALDSGAIDVTDLYSTDAEILYYSLLVLQDDRQFFPTYTAVLLYRDDLSRRAPHHRCSRDLHADCRPHLRAKPGLPSSIRRRGGVCHAETHAGAGAPGRAAGSCRQSTGRQAAAHQPRLR